MFIINTQGARNVIQEYLLTEPKVIGHLDNKDAEGTREEYRGYAKRTRADGIFAVTRVQQKRLILLMNWVKYQRRLGETNENHAENNKREK